MSRPTARLARWHIQLLAGSGAVLWLSGVAWLGLHYFANIEGPFGSEPHPLAPWMLRLHGAALIPALLAAGGLLVAHLPLGWRVRRQRLGGMVLAVVLSLLTLTGYLLYYVSGDAARSTSSVVHWAIGLALPLLFIWHSRRTRAR